VLTRRDIAVAAIAISTTVCAVAVAKQKTQGSTIFGWDSITATATSSGAVRQFFRGPTATLDNLDIHVTTLNPGQASHPPHQHANEELVIVKEGTLDVFINGQWQRTGPGSVIFIASNELHGVRNPGPGPAMYHVVAWTSHQN
jgi:quercetin dioxygenase-like cupin family protein